MKGHLCRVTIKDARLGQRGGRYYHVWLTPWQVDRHNNGALVSIGLTVPDDLRASTLQRWINSGRATPITYEEWNR